jgi:DNA polymerase III subunit epsilon
VHGISAAALVGKPKFVDIVERLVTFIEGAECLMHNATFDCGFIDAELARAGHIRGLSDIGQITCTLKLARQRFPGERASLDALIDRAGLGVVLQKHSALEDAMLLAEVYFKALCKLPLSAQC